MLSFLKKYNYFLFLSALILIFALFTVYVSEIKIFEPITIRISGISQGANKIKVCGISPSGRVFEFKPDTLKKKFEIRNAYLKAIIIRLPQEICPAKSAFVEIKNDNGRTNFYSFSNINSLKNEITNSIDYSVPYKTEMGVYGKLSYLSRTIQSNISNKFLLVFVFFLLYFITIVFFRKEKNVAIFNYVILGILIFWGYFWLLLGAWYSSPNPEELALTATARDLGVFKSIEFLLLTYDGRYFINFMHAINPFALFGLKAYKFIAFSGLLLSVFSFWFLTKTILKNTVSNLKLIVISLLFTLSHLTLSPSIAYNLYWAYSSFIYLYPWAFMLLWMAFFIRFYQTDISLKKIMYYILGTIFLIASIGINEMFLVLNGFVLFIIFLTILINNKAKLKEVVPFILIGLGCMVFFVSCPGISFRFNSWGNTYRGVEYFATIISTSFSHYTISIYNWLFQSPVMIPLVLFISIFIADRFAIGIRRISYKWLTAAFIAIVFILYVMLFAYYIPMGIFTNYPSRIFDTIQYGFQIAVFLLIPLIVYLISKLIKLKLYNHLYLFTPLFLFLSLYFVINGKNNISTIKENYDNGVLQEFRNEMDQRMLTINKAGIEKNWKAAVVNEIDCNPKNLYAPFAMSNRNIDIWNSAYEVYYNIDEFGFKTDTITKLEMFFMCLKNELSDTIMINKIKPRKKPASKW